MRKSNRDQVEELRENMVEKISDFLLERKKSGMNTYLYFSSTFRVYISESEGDRYVQVPYIANAIYLDDNDSVMLDTEQAGISIFVLNIHEIAYIYDKLLDEEFEKEDEGPEYDSAGYSIADR